MSRRRPTNDYRDTVLLYLHRQGLPAATSLDPQDERALPLLGKSGLVTGLPWTLMARLPHQQADLSAMVAQASDLADHFGNESYAAVIQRKGYGVSSAYAITTLDVLAAAVKRDQLTAGAQT